MTNGCYTTESTEYTNILHLEAGSGVRGRRVAGRIGGPGRRGRGVKLWYRSKCMGAFLSRRVDPARIIISRHHLHKELVDKDNELYSALKFKSQKRSSLVSNKC